MGGTGAVRRWALAAACLVAVVALLPSGAAATGRPTPGPPPAIGLPGSHPCNGSIVPGPYTGSLGLEGGPLSEAAVDAVALEIDYSVTALVVEEPSGAVAGSSCVAETGSSTTNASGTFRYAPAIPSAACANGTSGTTCTEYEGPYGPVTIGLAGLPPSGYEFRSGSAVSPYVLDFVWELASVAIAPAGSPVTTSVGAPTTFAASGRAADGTSTPGPVTFVWALNGTGWEFADGALGPSAVVVAVPGAGVGTLSVAASALVNGTEETASGRTVTLVAIVTNVLEGGINRTAIDAGGSVAVDLGAVGATGFAYTASVDPGLGLPPVPLACGSTPSGQGEATLACATNLTYPSAGVAQPTAEITNGYSFATWTFSPVTIDPPPRLGVDPAAPVGYPGSAIPLSVVAAPGSGTLPFREACVQFPTLGTNCSVSSGPTWEFSVSASTPGRYGGTAWAIDGAGANGSAPFSVTVVPPPTVGAIVGLPAALTEGASANVSANLSGGALPARYWWNLSTAGLPLAAGTAPSDGAIPLVFAPTVPGPVRLTLEVVDALGGQASASAEIEVVVPPAARLALAEAPPTNAVTVGTPVPVAWQALTASGTVDAAFGSAAELSVDSPAGPAPWVNASGVGPLPALGNGSFEVPVSAWVGGVLALSIVERAAGPFTLSLSGPSLPGAPPTAGGFAGADRDEVALYGPRVVDPGRRLNATFWLVRDRFGNPVPGAILEVEFASGLATTETFVAAYLLPNGSSGLWLNFTAPGPAGGTFTVVDAAGVVVLGPIAVPALPGPTGVGPAEGELLAAVGLATAGLGVAAFARRRRRRAPDDGAAELQRLAEGRAATLGIVDRLGPVDLGAIEAAWTPGPPPAELADWLASLVADGSLGAIVGADGVARFCRGTQVVEPPRITVNPDDLDRAMRRRAEALGSDEDAR